MCHEILNASFHRVNIINYLSECATIQTKTGINQYKTKSPGYIKMSVILIQDQYLHFSIILKH